MDFGLKDKIALVAGASKGLGLAVAEALGMEGAKVAICSRNKDNLEKARRGLEDLGIEVFSIQADVSVPEQAQTFVTDSAKHFGGADILINNAGGPPAMLFEETDKDIWEQGFRLNLLSTIIMTRTVIPYMKEKMWGRIVNMTSIAVKQPIDGLIISNTVRSGVIGLAKTLSRELASYNITVNNVCPGYFLTSRVSGLANKIAEKTGGDPSDVIKTWEKDIPLARMGEPKELGALVCFLCSSSAAYITGTSIQIDGGLYRGLL
ncbi:MAG TPA: SDR family oxidoreductase [Deltaproteobacteria bacterium]|nr:SDR family oxidoreductase [Deltaproteobacteria bacterium]